VLPVKVGRLRPVDDRLQRKALQRGLVEQDGAGQRLGEHGRVEADPLGREGQPGSDRIQRRQRHVPRGALRCRIGAAHSAPRDKRGRPFVHLASRQLARSLRLRRLLVRREPPPQLLILLLGLGLGRGGRLGGHLLRRRDECGRLWRQRHRLGRLEDDRLLACPRLLGGRRRHPLWRRQLRLALLRLPGLRVGGVLGGLRQSHPHLGVPCREQVGAKPLDELLDPDVHHEAAHADDLHPLVRIACDRTRDVQLRARLLLQRDLVRVVLAEEDARLVGRDGEDAPMRRSVRLSPACRQQRRLALGACCARRACSRLLPCLVLL